MDKEEARQRREKFIEEARIADEKRRVEFEALRALDEDYLDEDGYPTDHALTLIEQWHYSDLEGLFAFMKSIWWMPSWGWTEVQGGKDDWLEEDLPETTMRYHISTGGWSGNESIIRSLQKNFLWGIVWVQSRRGGHYIFEIKDYENEN